MSLSGRVALVTGAGSPTGIGFATAQLLAEKGARVAITSTTSRIEDRAKELADRGAEVFAKVADLTSREQTEHLLKEVLRHYSRIDILVNNAGMIQVDGASTPEDRISCDESSVAGYVGRKVWPDRKCRISDRPGGK